VTRVLVLIAIAAAACRQDDRRAPRTRVEAMEALTSCTRALSAIRSTDEVSRFPDACTAIIREPRCHDAFASAKPAPPEDWRTGVIAACAPAYCPLLAAPRPKACDPGGAEAWPELQAAIMMYELGADDAQLRAQVVRAFAPRDVTIAKPPARPPGPRAQCDAHATAVVEVAAGGGTFVAGYAVAPCGGAIDRAGLGAAMCKTIAALTCVPEVVVMAGDKASHADVVAVMELAKSYGVTRLAIGSSTDGAPNAAGITAAGRAAPCDPPPPTCP
jgi:hypothetical protein